MPKVLGASGCPPPGTHHLPWTSQHPKHHSGYQLALILPPAPQTPCTGARCSCITPLNGGYLYRLGSRGSCRKQSPAVFHLLFEQAPVFGQANRTLNSPDSSGGASRGWRHCPRPPRHGHAHQPWPFAPTAGSSFSGGGVPLWGGSEAPGCPQPPNLPSKAPPRQSLPTPGCTVKIQQHRMWPTVLGLLWPRHPEKSCTHENPKHHLHPLAQRPSLQEMVHILLRQPSSLSVIPASLCLSWGLLLRRSSWRNPHHGGLA